MSKNATKNMEENRCFICFQFKEWVKLLNLNQFRSIKSCEINLYLLSRDKLFQSSLIFLNLILIFNEGIFWKFKGWVLHFYFKLWKIIVNMILQKYSALQTYFFLKNRVVLEIWWDDFQSFIITLLFTVEIHKFTHKG